MSKALFYSRQVKFYTDNVRASVTNSMSACSRVSIYVAYGCLTNILRAKGLEATRPRSDSKTTQHRRLDIVQYFHIFQGINLFGLRLP